MLPSRSRLGLTGLGSSQDLGSSNGDLYYNSRPEGHWSYQPPPPPVITHQPKPSSTQHFQPYERGYPKTLESLAEKVSLRDASRADIRIFTRIEIHRKDGEANRRGMAESWMARENFLHLIIYVLDLVIWCSIARIEAKKTVVFVFPYLFETVILFTIFS